MLLNDMATVLRSGGSVVEEVPGWVGRNHGQLTQVDCIVIHHTATPASASGDYPSLTVVRDGRSGLAGPLAQLGAGRSGKIYVISNGVAWHAGTTLQTWMDNQHSIGIEVESPGTGAVWPDAQVQGVARAVAALCKRYGVPASRVLGHKEICSPVGRKIDPVGIPGDMPAFRSLVQQYINGSRGGFLMALTDQQQTDLYNAVDGMNRRILGFLRQRWYVVNADGTLSQVAQGTANAVPATALDTLDGNYLVGLLSELSGAVETLTAKVDALASARAVTPKV
jgi:hypothetical protein